MSRAKELTGIKGREANFNQLHSMELRCTRTKITVAATLVEDCRT